MSVGLWQILVVLVIVLLLFGRGRISQSMADLAKGIKAFRHGLKEEDHETPPQDEPLRPLPKKLDHAAASETFDTHAVVDCPEDEEHKNTIR